VRDILFSLQTKLIAAFALVTLAGLAIGGVVFVAAQRDEEEERAVEHVIATSPAVYSEFTFLQRRGDPESELAEFIDAAADEHDLRILLVSRADGSVAADSADELTNELVVVPQPVRGSIEQPVAGQPYVSWAAEKDGPAEGLTLITALPSRLGAAPPRGAEQYWLVLAVPENTIREAWRDLLPALMLAAAIALPIAAGLAMLVAAYVTRPLHQLTVASQRMAEGNFDVRVNVDRSDEVGRLARTFSTMAQRVGETHTQMRQLVANVSHDLKTPLTSILGFSQALRDGRAQDEPDAQRMGGVIYDEASRLSQRLNDLLYLSEIESGQALLEREDVDVERLVRQAVARIEDDVASRGVAISTELDAGMTVRADGPKLERAVENLLDNARKYTPAGGEIAVRSYRDEAQARVCIEVANTAPGVSEEELPRLFERFYRLDGARGQRSADGTGLGLAIARDLVELHGGTLEATLDGGRLVFTIRLPLQS
jgi:signal transduction histidine kinase